MAKVVKKILGHVVGDMNLDTITEYEVPTTYTPPASGITVRAFFGRVTRGLADLIEGKANKSDVLQTLEQISANTDSNKLAGAAALRELNNKMDQRPRFPSEYKVSKGSLTNLTTSGYTAPEDGRAYILFMLGANNGYAQITINGGIYLIRQNSGAQAANCGENFLLRKGDIVKASFANASSVSSSAFYGLA